MTVVREPRLEPVAILDLRPTQMTVGMREVKAKRERWRAEKKGGEFLGKHMIPVVLGPKHRHYVIDHHHLARALHDEGVKNVPVTVIANLSKLDRDTFWFVMDCRDWTHPFEPILKLRWRKRLNWQKAWMPITCRVGAVRSRGMRRSP